MAMQALQHYRYCISVGSGAFSGSCLDLFSLFFFFFLMFGQLPVVMINFWHLEMSRMMQKKRLSLFISTSTRTKWGGWWRRRGGGVRFFNALTGLWERKRKTTESWYSHHTTPQSLPLPRKGLTSPSSCSLLDWRAEHCATCTLQSANGQHTPRGCSRQSLAHFTSVYRAEDEPHVEISFNHWTLPLKRLSEEISHFFFSWWNLKFPNCMAIWGWS